MTCPELVSVAVEDAVLWPVLREHLADGPWNVCEKVHYLGQTHTKCQISPESEEMNELFSIGAILLSGSSLQCLPSC